MKDFILPEWTKGLPDSTLLNSRDVRLLFGYAKTSSISCLIKGNYIPKPDEQISAGFDHTNKHWQWKLGSLRELEGKNG